MTESVMHNQQYMLQILRISPSWNFFFFSHENLKALSELKKKSYVCTFQHAWPLVSHQLKITKIFIL